MYVYVIPRQYRVYSIGLKSILDNQGENENGAEETVAGCKMRFAISAFKIKNN